MTIAVVFEEFADPGAPCVFHCQVLAHKDHRMMGRLLVSTD